MPGRRWSTRSIALGAVLGVALAWGGFSIAEAVIPAPGGVVKACYKTKNGNLRVRDSAASCKSGETAIQWNQTGPRGAAGTTTFADVNCANCAGGPVLGVHSSDVLSVARTAVGKFTVTLNRNVSLCVVNGNATATQYNGFVVTAGPAGSTVLVTTYEAPAQALFSIPFAITVTC